MPGIEEKVVYSSYFWKLIIVIWVYDGLGGPDSKSQTDFCVSTQVISFDFWSVRFI